MLNINATLNLDHFRDVVFKKNTKSKVEESHQFLFKFAKNKIIYDLNTSFGPMAQYKIEASKTKELQYNLIRSHASGTGEFLDEVYVNPLYQAD